MPIVIVGTRLDRPGLDRLRDGAEAGAFEAALILCPGFAPAIIDSCARARSLHGTPWQRPDASNAATTPNVRRGRRQLDSAVWEPSHLGPRPGMTRSPPISTVASGGTRIMPILFSMLIFVPNGSEYF